MPRRYNPLFAKDVQLGNLAVKKAYSILRDAGLEPKVVSEKGYDIVLGDGRKVEVKFDVVMDTTGNLGGEWWSDREVGDPGWLQYSDADVLIQFHDMDNAVVVDMQKLADWVEKNFDDFEKKPSKYSNAEMVLIPVDEIPESVKVPEIGNLIRMDYALSDDELDAIRGRVRRRRK